MVDRTAPPPEIAPSPRSTWLRRLRCAIFGHDPRQYALARHMMGCSRCGAACGYFRDYNPRRPRTR